MVMADGGGVIEEWNEMNNEYVELFGEPIPTVSQWGVVVMLSLLALAAAVVFRRRRGPATG